MSDLVSCDVCAEVLSETECARSSACSTALIESMNVQIKAVDTAVNLKPSCARQEISRLREVDILCESNLQY